MKIAVTYENGEVFQHFGHTEQFKVYDVEDGKIVGWTEKPDGNMLRYLLGHLGKNEGFGDSIDVTTNGKDVNSVNLFKVLTKEEIQNFNTQFENEY